MTDVQELLKQYRQEYDRAMPAIRKLEEALSRQRALLDALEIEIKETVKERGQSEQGHGIVVTFRSGYVKSTWDNKKLEGFAAAHPAIFAFRKQTDVAPSVSMKVSESA